MSYERIKAGDIRPGDRVARARTHNFKEVDYVRPGQVAIGIHYKGGQMDRPRKTASWWKETK